MAIALVVIRHLESHVPVLHNIITSVKGDSDEERQRMTATSVTQVQELVKKFPEFQRAKFYRTFRQVDDFYHALT